MKTLLAKLSKYTFLLFIIFLISSCGTRKDIVYFQDIDQFESSKSIKNYMTLIKPDDILTINVSALDFDLAKPFNLPATSFLEQDGGYGRTIQQTYLVDINGNIDFPVLGTIKLGNLNRIQATSLLKDMLKEYIKDPIVNIRIMNFKVTILGDVRNPGSYTIPNERITVLEALGLAGDLTIQAERKNILVVREENGVKNSYRLDLTSKDFFNSPVYYLSQNDVIYIEPNNSRIKSSTVGPNTSTTLGVISTLAGLATVIISITR